MTLPAARVGARERLFNCDDETANMTRAFCDFDFGKGTDTAKAEPFMKRSNGLGACEDLAIDGDTWRRGVGGHDRSQVVSILRFKVSAEASKHGSG